KINGRTHMILLVEIDEASYIVDVGFGGLASPYPLKLVANEEQVTPLSSYRFLRSEVGFVLQTKVENDWKTLYTFDLQSQYLIDFEIGNYYTSTNPNSSFLRRLVVTLLSKDARYALHNNSFSIYRNNDKPEKRILTSVNEIKEVMM